jgi:phage terminase Nu1 subunit (DNA packaging protein)
MKPIDAPKPRARVPAAEPFSLAALAQLAQSIDVADPRNLKPGELLRTLNSTPLGTVVTELKLRGHRARGGAFFETAGGKRIDLLRYIAWLAIDGRRKERRGPEVPTLKELASGAGVSERTLNTWIKRGCPRGLDRGGARLAGREHPPAQRRPAASERTAADRRRSRCSSGSTRPRPSDAEESARTKRLKRRLLQKRLMPIDQVVREAAEIFTEVRAIIESIPDAVAKEVPQQLRTRIYDVVRNKITAALKKLASLHSLGSADAA